MADGLHLVTPWSAKTLLQKLSDVLWETYKPGYAMKSEVYAEIKNEIERLEKELLAERSYKGICEQ